MPLFVVGGHGIKREINAMPGQYNISVDVAVERAQALWELGVRSTLLFAIPDFKDDTGSSSWQSDGIIQQTVKAIKKVLPEMLVVTDLCFCEYTSHGHCGVMHDGKLDNDATLEILVNQTLSHAESGADIVAPSGMLDGAVGTMRSALDDNGYSNIPIMAYSAKMASAFYGPFREAVQSAPSYGDRKTYQMDPANLQEALRETAIDIEEGADIVMVKPALPCLDIIRETKNQFPMPLAAYNVSGEYSMIKAAGRAGWIDERKVMLETLLAIKRAGADITITYFAEDYAKLYRAGSID